MARGLGQREEPARSAKALLNTYPTYPAAVADSVALEMKIRMLKSSLRIEGVAGEVEDVARELDVVALETSRSTPRWSV